MPCYHPLNAWQKAPGIQPIFSPPSRPDGWTKLQLPCSQCIGCRVERSRQWATRCIHEASLHNDNSFITLTYDDDHVPYGGTLVKAHFQKFMKRLRRRYQGKKIRYYMCGEYGGELGRPHYHAILFGHDFVDKTLWKTNEGNHYYISEQLEDLWPAGFSTIADVTWQTAAYVSRYVLKKRTGKEADNGYYERFVGETGEIIQLEPEYNSMSLKPAIGAEWFEAYQSDCYPKDFVTHNGRKLRVPRYYDELLRRQDEAELQRLKQTRKEAASQWSKDQTPARLKVREQVAKARLAHLSRELQ